MEEMIYAFRIFGDNDEPWYGNAEALQEYENSICAFDSGANPSPFADKTLEFRYGLMPDDGQPPLMRGYTKVGEMGALRPVRVRADIQAILFPGHG